MSGYIEATDLDSPEDREFRQDYYRRTVEEIRVAVTRGSTGIEASYLLDQGALGFAREDMKG